MRTLSHSHTGKHIQGAITALKVGVLGFLMVLIFEVLGTQPRALYMPHNHGIAKLHAHDPYLASEYLLAKFNTNEYTAFWCCDSGEILLSAQ